MSQRHELLLICLSALIVASSGAGEWDYKDHGPSHWAKNFPQFCAGNKQSPIDLTVQQSQHDSLLKQYAFSQAVNGSQFKLKLRNDGHKVELSWSPELLIQMGLSAGNQMYTAAQLHWHWGADSHKGSEHTLDKKSYPAEGHLVFYNSFDYANLGEAVNRPNGLAVLGVFYVVSDHDNLLFSFLDRILGNDSLVSANGMAEMTVNAADFNLFDKFLPADRTEFFRYDGSLTTPTCYESVLWTVYKNTVPISERQLNLLRRLKYTDNSTMTDNFRPPLPLNPSNNRPGTSRILYRTFSSGSVPRLALGCLVSAVLLARLAVVAV